MKKLFTKFLFLLLYLSFGGVGGALLAQLPVASGPGSGLLYFAAGGNSNIYNYDPNQPISASNPSINTISLPSLAPRLAVGSNLNSVSPPLTFYTIVVSGSLNTYSYYNGTSWINTGYSSGSSNAVHIGAGGGHIYNVNGGVNVYQYNGTANSNLLASYPSYPSIVGDIAADCVGNYYLLIAPNPGDTVLRKYDSTGTLVDTFIVTGAQHINGNALAILNNKIFFGGYSPYGLRSGVLIGHTIHCSLVSSSIIFNNIADLSSYPGSAFNSIIASADTVYYCSGGPGVQVYGTGPGPYTWSVLSGPATISGSGDTVTLSSTANATVLLSSSFSSPCGSSTDTVTLIVNPSPSLPNIISNSPLCSGDSLQLGINNSQAGVSYSWSGPLGFNDTLLHSGRSHMQLNDSGYYYITALSSNGCNISDSANITVKPTPLLPLAVSNSPLCEYDSLLLHATDSTGVVSYNWYGPNAFSSSTQNPIRLYAGLNDSGKYRVRATLNGCSSGYDTTTIIIMPVIIPTVSISSQPAIIPAGHIDTFTAHVNSGCNSPTYQWYMNSNKIAGAVSNPYVTFLTAADHISVTVHCAGCSNPDSAQSNQLTTTGVTSLQSAISNVRVWPNPIADELNIEIIGLTTNNGIGIKIYDIVGRVVYTSSPSERSGEAIISTRNFSKGTYILELTASDGSREIRKIVKE